MMKVAISGATGLVGVALSARLRELGHDVYPLVRSVPGNQEIGWNPPAGTIDREKMDGLDAVVHLAGENVAGRRWSDAQKQKIMDSRVQGTRLLAMTLASVPRKPRVLVSASAIGFYGDQRPGKVDESSESGDGFLAEVCRAWEAATKPARDAGIRTVNMRIGVVLSKSGGALEKMLMPFKMCAGGVIGSGKQVWSWIAIMDLIEGIVHAIDHETIDGPMNATSPNAVTNAEFTKTLGHVLGRPTIVPMPAFAARLAFGELADGLLLSSSRVHPGKLIESGYEFKYPYLEPALRVLLK